MFFLNKDEAGIMVIRRDTTILYHSPEGIELTLLPAGPLARGLAWTIDFGFRTLLYIFLGILLYWAGGVGRGVFLLCVFVLEWFYPVFFEVKSGATPGKKMIGLVVVHDDGTPISLSSSLLRNLLRPVDFLPMFNMVGLFSMVCNKRFRRLGDFAAGTLVVYKQQENRCSNVQLMTPQPPPFPLKLWQQRLILDFCERSGSLSQERRMELASLLTELTGDKDPERALISYGNWFLKGRGGNEPNSI